MSSSDSLIISIWKKDGEWQACLDEKLDQIHLFPVIDVEESIGKVDGEKAKIIKMLICDEDNHTKEYDYRYVELKITTVNY